MKLLIIGNSQSAALKRAFDSRPGMFSKDGIDVHFYVIPGGSGPDFLVENGRLVPGNTIATHPPFMAPPGTDEIPLEEFDAVLMSALGYFDGGFRHRNIITRSGVLADCGPRGRAARRAPVSDVCYGEIISALMERQNGIRALRTIAAAYDGPLFVQRWPHLSEAILDHKDWELRDLYTSPVKAYQTLSRARDAVLERIGEETGAQLLDYPDVDHPRGFTPRELMREVDCLHQDDAYAVMILEDIRARLKAA